MNKLFEKKEHRFFFAFHLISRQSILLIIFKIQLFWEDQRICAIFLMVGRLLNKEEVRKITQSFVVFSEKLNIIKKYNLNIPYARHYNLLLIRNRSWILAIHKAKGHST